jgi:hypothetical protein
MLQKNECEETWIDDEKTWDDSGDMGNSCLSSNVEV